MSLLTPYGRGSGPPPILTPQGSANGPPPEGANVILVELFKYKENCYEIEQKNQDSTSVLPGGFTFLPTHENDPTVDTLIPV